jgi:hypothetical protein
MLGVLASCGFQPLAVTSDGGSGSNTIDAPNGQACFGPSGWRVCLSSLPGGSTTLPPTINTDTSPLCLPEQPASWVSTQPDACIITGSTIVAASTVMATGDRPLVLLATDAITISGTLDVASHVGGSGPGANRDCPAFGRIPSSGSTGGGGAGGSLTTAGGNGGTSAGVATSNGLAAATLGVPTTLHGGCAGEQGGDGNGTTVDHGQAGSGGGAVYVLAANSIAIAGTINASGASSAGAGASSHCGGGGGGSGGTIALYASTIDAAGAKLVANGGGGSSGGSNNGLCHPASDPDPATPLSPASGASSQGTGRDGGAGFAQGHSAVNGTAGPQNDDGGGGGGGGGGCILVHGVLASLGAASPTPVTTL